MRLIVTGWRGADARHRPTVESGLYRYRQTYEPYEVILVHGDGSGADQLAAEVAREWGWTVEPHPADWNRCGDGCPPRMHRRVRHDGEMYCPFAGPRRNRVMCELGGDLVIAFPASGSTGTWDCVKAGAARGIPFVGYPLTSPGRPTPSGRRSTAATSVGRSDGE